MTKNTRPRTTEFREMLAQEYLNTTISIQELSNKYHTDAAYQLKKHGIALKGRGVQKMLSRNGCIKYSWDASEINTEEQAYSLGFLMADGYNTGCQVGLRVKSSDIEILKRIKDCFSKDIKLQEDGTSVSFVISSTIICNTLKAHGIIEHKSRNEKNIPALKQDLIRHFIRGYFDGDGTIFICKVKNNRFFKCNICSSTVNIINEMKEILTKEGITCSIDREKRVGKTYIVNNTYSSVATMDMYRLYIRRKSAIEKLFHYLYDDSTIYLQRKYRVFTDNSELFVYHKHVNTELTK